MKLRTVHSLALAGLLGVNFCLTAGTRAASPAPTGEARKSRAPQGASTAQTPAPAETRDHPGGVAEADSLVENSKRAIIETGISESYFEKHFKLVKAVNEPADRRVEWSYSVDEYEAQLVDAIGFHTTGGSRTHIHGIKNQLYSTHEIVKTMPRARARKILRSCIGVFDGETTTYRALTVPGTARLYLTGRSRVIKRDRIDGAAGGKTFKFFYIGFVDVESGKCVKKVAKVRS
jgi:hypothetical protein